MRIVRAFGVYINTPSKRIDPVYDLLYAVLARRTGCTVLTMDERLKKLLGQMGIHSGLA